MVWRVPCVCKNSDAARVLTFVLTLLQALVFQQRAVMMSERVLGIDHPNTITEYSHFALYCFANGQIPTALKIMYRARYLALLCHGENHPDVALYDVSHTAVLACKKKLKEIIFLLGFCDQICLLFPRNTAALEMNVFGVLQSNIGLILHALMEFNLSLEYLQKALDVNIK